MESLRELYRIGYGPSSSHTMGPRAAAEAFIKEHPEATKVQAELYGSLAATGKGHLTDRAIREVFQSHSIPVDILWFPDQVKPFHPNAVTLRMVEPDELSETYYSVGGGKIVKDGEEEQSASDVYDGSKVGTMERLLSYCEDNGYQIWEVAIEAEGDGIVGYMAEVWEVMKAAIRNGLEAEGVLPGGLHLQRKACQAYAKARDLSGLMGSTAHAFSYALAVSEENAGGGRIVTAPTCGSCGVLPGVLYHLASEYEIPEPRILRALLTAGIIGNIVKENGSISGAEVGAEMGLEHHLGLTCDPLMGLVQIPCIERNAMATMRAIDHASYALLGDGHHKISFDDVVEVMMETGHALPSLYRETSMGGLARIFER